MDYLTDIDRAILLSGALGLVVGFVTNAQELGFDWWLKKEWLGWDRAISRAVVSAIVWALVLGAIAFISILYEPTKPVAQIRNQVFSIGIFSGLLLPITTRAGLWLAGRLLRLRESEMD